MKCVFIYNPVGGKGLVEKKKDYIVGELKKKYDEVEVRATRCAGDMTVLANEAAKEADAIIFAGGDGSFHELLQAIAPMDEPPVLGYLPTGTVNDVAHSLKIPAKLKKALRIINEGKVEQIDCMKVNDIYTIYVAAAGAFTSATYTTPQINKNHIGRLAYGIEGLKHNMQLNPFPITCQGSEGQYVQMDGCVLVAFINSEYVAGFHMNKRANLQDGEMEVVLIEQKPKPNFFKKLGSYLSIAGLFLFGYQAKLPHVTHLKGKSFDVTFPEGLSWNLDGEKGCQGNIHVEIVPQKVKILLPNKKRRK